MKRLFIDSSVLFSAAYSARGHARDLIVMAAREEVILVISPLVLDETRRNLEESAPETLPLFDLLVHTIPFEIIQPTKEDVLDAAKVVVLKDAPIVAAAKSSRADMLVTLDKKHLLDKPTLVQYLGVQIVTAKGAVDLLPSLSQKL
jgi:predicted nucleic acid-binding protein